MNNIDEILERLKGAQPEIDNPDEFTDLIMSALPDRNTESKTPEKESRIVKFVRIVLTAAAVLLVGLFIYTNDLDADTPTITQTNYQISGFTYGDYLKNVYTNRHNNASINYSQLKKLNYENH
ncbi:MAG: hypothetical protein J5595_05225 [Bacteroidales bacterium]|nr:hypothetical protein [Bacteroidales bacterium]